MFVSKPSENDREEVLQQERSSCDKANKFIFRFISIRIEGLSSWLLSLL